MEGHWKAKSSCAVLIIYTFISGHIHLWSSEAVEVSWTRCSVQPRGCRCPDRKFLALNYLCNKRLLLSSKWHSETERGGFVFFLISFFPSLFSLMINDIFVVCTLENFLNVLCTAPGLWSTLGSLSFSSDWGRRQWQTLSSPKEGLHVEFWVGGF